jgi:hypothetical protein
MAKKLSSFGKAFAEARRKAKEEGGPNVFTWNNGKYTTEIAEEKAAREKAGKTFTPTSTGASTSTPSAATPAATPAAASAAASASNATRTSRTTKTPRETEAQKNRRIAAQAEKDAAAQAKLEGRPTGDREGMNARFKNLLGMGSSASTRLAENSKRLAKQEEDRAKSIAEYATKRDEEKKASLEAKQKERAAIIAKGSDPDATPAEKRKAKFYRENPNAMKKGGKVKKYAHGGKVSSASKRADGCAIRGKTRAR